MTVIKVLDINELTENIDYLINLSMADEDNITVEYIRKRILSIMNMNYGILLMEARFKNIYRVRPNNGVDYFNNISDLWYPPSYGVGKRGRFNDVKESMFYCSDAHDTCIFECHMNPGDTFTLLMCEAIDLNQPLIFSDLFIDSFPTKKRVKVTDGYIKQRKIANQALIELDKMNQHRIIQKFIEDQTMREVEKGEEYNYKISIAIKRILLGDPMIDGIVYPSMAADRDYINFALRTEAVDRYYRPIKAFKMKLTEGSGKDYMSQCIGMSNSIDLKSGNIKYETKDRGQAWIEK